MLKAFAHFMLKAVAPVSVITKLCRGYNRRMLSVICEIMWSELNNTRAPLFLCVSAVGDPPLSATHSRIMHVFTEVGCVCSVLW